MASSLPTSEIEFSGEESTELSEVNDTDRDDVDSSYLLHTSSNPILHLWLVPVSCSFILFLSLIKSSFLENNS